MRNFFKGILVGIGNIVPGLSGSAMLIIFGLYKDCLNAIGNIFNNFKKNFLFLLPIGLGIIIGTVSFSKIIIYLIEKYYVITYLIFIGFICGTIPKLFEEANKKGFKKNYLLFSIISFILGLILLFIKSNTMQISITSFNISNIFILIAMGLIISCSTIIPGISTTILLSLMGTYKLYVTAIASLNLKILIPIIISFTLCSFFISKILNFLLNKYYSYTFYFILGFILSTIPTLIPLNLKFNIDFIIGILLSIIAFYLTYKMNKKT